MNRRLRRRCQALLAFGALLALGLAFGWAATSQAQSLQLLPTVTVDGEPVAPWPLDNSEKQLPGSGLCGGFRSAGNRFIFAPRTGNFPNDKYDFPQSVNDFLDLKKSTGMDGLVHYQTLTSSFDLSNQVNIAGFTADGDFVNTSGCPTLGCDFPGSSGEPVQSQPFGTRYRGFINIKPEWAGQPMKFGLVAENAVAVWIFAMPPPPPMGSPPSTAAKSYLLMSHGLDNGRQRVTNEVVFPKAGLYPIEILHAYQSFSAVLEFAILFNRSDYPNYDDKSGMYTKLNQPPEFSLVYTQPDNFFQTANGAVSYTPPACKQCPREYAKPSVLPLPPNTCDNGFFCNAAALCESCPYDLDKTLCTPNCIHCQKPTPICYKPDASQPANSQCVECVTDMDCQNGFVCTAMRCTPKRPPAIACPGSPGVGVGSNLQPVNACDQIAAISPCAKDADCPDGQVCDITNTRCIDKLAECRFDDRCGKDCVNCKNVASTGKARPFCLNAQVCVECRIDTDCELGNYCLSGDCTPCTDDRHCGPVCVNCAFRVGPPPLCEKTVTNTPFCSTPNSMSASATCVGCRSNDDCGDGNTCDPASRTCKANDPQSQQPCPTGTVRKGADCVECVSSSQCLCGSCDPASNSCVNVCKDNTDCQGNQCCTRAPDGSRKCVSGRCAGTAGGALCGCSVTSLASIGKGADNNTIAVDDSDIGRSRGLVFGVFSMLLCALLFRRSQLLRALRPGGSR